MHYSPPMFDNRRDIRLWRKINSTTGKQSAIKEILSGNECVHSAVLVKAIQIVDKKGVPTEKKKNKPAAEDGSAESIPEIPERTVQQVMSELVIRSRPSDCLAGVEAAKCMLNRSDCKSAMDMINAVSRKGEIFHTNLMLAEIRAIDSDPDGARDVAIKAYESNPFSSQVYDILKVVDVAGEWPIKQAIQMIYAGEEPMVSSSSGDYRELYSIYSSWFRGNKDNAQSLLIESDKYQDGDPEYILAAARMSASERDWSSAKKLYLSILDGAPQYLKCEIAEALLSGGEPMKALDILRKSDKTDIRVLRDTVRACASNGVGLKEAIDDFVDSEFADGDEITSVARVLISANRVDEAERILAKYLEQEPKHSQSLALMSEIRLRQDKVKNATLLSKRAARDRKNVAAKVQRARMMFINNDVKGADKKCSAILRKDPFQRDALILKRDIYIATEEYKEALEVCNRILDLIPGDAETLIVMSEAYSGLGSGNNSMELFKKALHADLNWDNSCAVLESLIEHGLNTEAVEICEDLYKDFPDNAMLRRLKGNAEYCIGEYESAVKSYSESLSIDSNNPVVWHSKGMAEEARGDYHAAEDSYNRAVILDLSEPEYWISKACIQDVMGDRFGAVESLNRAIELDPGNVFALVRKAMIFDSSNRTREAVFYMEMALITAPDDRDILRETIRMCIQSGVAVKALPYAERLNKLSPLDSPLLYAKCMLLNGEVKKAAEVTERALAVNHNDMSLLRCRYDCYMVNKEFSQAASICNRMKEVDPSNPEIDELREKAEKGIEIEIFDPLGDGSETVRCPPDDDAIPTDEVPAGEEVQDKEYVSDDSDEVVEEPEDEIEDISDEPTAVEGSPEKESSAPNTDAMLDDAEKHIEEKRLSDALSLLETVIDIDPKITRAHALLGRLYDMVGNVSDAVSELDHAIFQGTDDCMVYAIRGSIYESCGESKDAISCYQKAISYDSDDPEVYRSLSYLLNEQGDYRGAMKAIRGSIGRADTPYLPDFKFYAELAIYCGDDEALKDAYEIFMATKFPDSDRDDFMKIIGKSGHSLEEFKGKEEAEGSEDKTSESDIEEIGTDDDSVKTTDIEEIEINDGEQEVSASDDESEEKTDRDEVSNNDDEERIIFVPGNDKESEKKDDAEEVEIDDVAHGPEDDADDDSEKTVDEPVRDEPKELDPSMKKKVASILRYAYSSMMDPLDPDVYENNNVSESDMKAIMNYLNDIPDYGRIDETAYDFEKMEMRSMDIILRCNLTNLDSGTVPIEAVFSKGNCADVDDAKRMCSYICTASMCDADTDDDVLVDYAMQVPKDAKLHEIVKEYSVGIYAARAIQLMARNM